MMRLAGTVNHKTGEHARVVEADFALPGVHDAELVGDLPDPAPAADRRAGAARGAADGPLQTDRAAGVLPAARRHHRPARRARGAARRPDTPTATRRAASAPRRSKAGAVTRDCGARGAIYDLASVLSAARGAAAARDAFTRARARVASFRDGG